jgi:hypothetical protein
MRLALILSKLNSMLTNIANFNNNGDWLYLVIGAIVVDFIVIVLTKYPGPEPYFKVRALNEWYDRFGLLAAISDIGSALIGIGAARYIYTWASFTGPLLFIACIIGFQLFHDIFFYLAIILKIPKGENQMIDVFKSYAAENGGKILVADALILLGTAGVGSFLKSLPTHYTVSTGLLATYAMTYILYTKRA